MDRFYRLLSLCALFLFASCNTMDQDVTVLKNTKGEKFYTGLKVPPNFKPTNVKSARASLRGTLPAEFDARVKGYKAPENQGGCGSCWAFSMSTTVQDSYKFQKGGDFDTSEQHVLSCTKPGEYTCNGGFFDYNRHMDPFGGVTDNEWPYSASDEPCKTGLNHQLRIKSWSYLPGNDNPSIDEIKAAIYQYGIVSVGVAADDAFSNYSGGVFQGSGSTQLNHAVNLVGWSDSGQYWILKNSWGPNWGEGGYMKIKWGANGVGAWANYVVLGDDPAPNPSPTPTPEPKPTPTPDPTCQPQPYADTRYGDVARAKPNQRGTVGTPGRPGHTYYWTAVPAFDNNAVPREPVINYTARITKRLTVHAVTKCGEATDSVTIQVVNGVKKTQFDGKVKVK